MSTSTEQFSLDLTSFLSLDYTHGSCTVKKRGLNPQFLKNLDQQYQIVTKQFLIDAYNGYS